ncbi:MAG: hypothetical protein BMS9Abin20_1141 [Acidimicrobiia bacterium]|nr:MAG: hypothetical protein BMS9Abin20_1141 [Acidimicrobiia bacterium]
MTTRERTSPQIQPYLDVLESRLGDLPAEERSDLLGDLESHLEEILTDESADTLSDRIGTPDAYADEFVASTGIAGTSPTKRTLTETMSDSLRWIRSHPSADRARRCGEEMRPAWWTTRGLAIGLLLMWNYLWPGNPNFPWILVSWAVVMLPLIIWASMRVGRNHQRTPAWKWLSIAVTIAGVFAIFALAANVSARLDTNSHEYDSYPYGSQTEQDIQFMSEHGMSPEEYFEGLWQGEHGPPITYVPSAPPLATP